MCAGDCVCVRCAAVCGTQTGSVSGQKPLNDATLRFRAVEEHRGMRLETYAVRSISPAFRVMFIASSPVNVKHCNHLW